MAEANHRDIFAEQASTDEKAVSLCTDVTLSDDDLSEEAKAQFDYHGEILRIFKLHACNVLANDRLSPVGRHLFCTLLEKNYMNSKLVLNYVAAHPEVKTTGHMIPFPLVLCGLPRTGTTLLYNLLACDPTSRAPLFTEMTIQPVPPLARSDTAGQMQRNIVSQSYNEMFNALGLIEHQRNMDASHPWFAYEEDLFILNHTGVQWFNTLLTPHDNNELLRWFYDDTNKNFAYEYHKTFIEMLNSVDPPHSHWLFKTPIHGLYLDTFLRHYPSALLIMTHRQLDDVLSSVCRLATVFLSLYFDSNKADITIDMQTAVGRTLHLMDLCIHRLAQFRRTHLHIPCFDVLYDDLLAQPIDTVRRIYKHFGLVWSKEFEVAMLKWLHDNPQGKQGRNAYTLDDCGMTRDEIERRYEEYNNMFLNTCNSSTT